MALGPIFGVLFDGFAYGMLLFLLSVGLSVTLGMMNFVNLAHCAFAMLGGYTTVTLIERLRLAVPGDAAAGLPGRGGGQRRLRAHALPPALPRQRARSGAADDRARLHVGGDRGLSVRHHAAARCRRRPICAAPSISWASRFGAYRPVPRRDGAGDRAAPGADARVHALRRPGARCRRQPAHGARPRHQRRRCVRGHLRARERARRPRRRARHRDRRPRSRTSPSPTSSTC